MEDKIKKLDIPIEFKELLDKFPATYKSKKMLLDLLISEKLNREKAEKLDALIMQNEELKAKLKEWDQVKNAICNHPNLTVGSDIPKKAAEILVFALRQFKLI